MNLRDLLAVQALVTTGTTKGAAVNIGVSQPTISRAVMEMEAYFRQQLFARQHGRLVPTAAALRISRSAADISAVLQTLGKDLDGLTAEQVLRVGLSPCHGSSLIHPALRRFASLQPSTTVKLLLLSEGEMGRALAEGEVDVALSTQAHSADEMDVEQLLTVELCCLLSAGHPLAAQAAVTPAMLAGEPVVSVRSNDTLGRGVHAAFRDAGVAFNGRLEVASVSMACEFVGAGLGVAFGSAADLDGRPGLVARPFSPSIECRLFSMVRTSGVMHQAARQLCRLIRLTNKSKDAPRAAGTPRPDLAFLAGETA